MTSQHTGYGSKKKGGLIRQCKPKPSFQNAFVDRIRQDLDINWPNVAKIKIYGCMNGKNMGDVPMFKSRLIWIIIFSRCTATKAVT
ncbi:hypothetical protein LguiB_026616 [Lonicera macranthoides]